MITLIRILVFQAKFYSDYSTGEWRCHTCRHIIIKTHKKVIRLKVPIIEKLCDKMRLKCTVKCYK